MIVAVATDILMVVAPAGITHADADMITAEKIPIMNNTPRDIINTIINSHSPILCIDGRMDLDAYCSALALNNVLINYSEKRVALYSGHDKLSTYYENIINKFKIDLTDIRFGVDPTNLNFGAFDLQIFIDSGTIEHISQRTAFQINKDIKKVNIDHHLSNSVYGDLNYVQDYSSACSVLYEILTETKMKINDYTAKLLLIGILSDSNFLRNSNVKPIEFNMVADLVKISNFSIAQLSQLMSSNTIEDVKIKRIVYKNIEINKKAKYAYSFGSILDYQKEGLDSDYKGIPPVDVIKTIDGLNFVFFVREDKDKFNVSFRSVDMEFDVLKFAQKLDGGGHKEGGAGTI